MNKARITAASLLLSSALVTWNANANDTVKNNSEGNIAPTAVNMLKDAVASNVSDKLNLNNVDVLVRGSSYGLGYENQNIYWEVTSDFNDETWAWLAYKSDLGLVLGWNYSEKKDVWTQTWLWVWYIKSFDNSYLWASAKYTNFDANTRYADSDSIKAQLLWGYEVAPWLFVEAWVAYKTFQANDYKRENSLEWTLWLSYVTPEFTLRVSWTVDEFNSKAMASISFPIWGKNKLSSLNLWQSTLARSIANSSFDNSIVKVKKVPVVTPTNPETPISTPTISMSNQSITDNAWFSSTNLPAPTVSWVLPGATYSISYTSSVWALWSLNIDSSTWIITYLWDELWPTTYNVEITITNTDWWTQSTNFVVSVQDIW